VFFFKLVWFLSKIEVVQDTIPEVDDGECRLEVSQSLFADLHTSPEKNLKVEGEEKKWKQV